MKDLRTIRPIDELVWASGPLRALEQGTHRVDIYVLLWADHWDGFDDDPAENLLPAGESLFDQVVFTVE